MNGYVCFWRGKRIGVWASTSYDAQQAAAKLYQSTTRHKVKSSDISVTLAETAAGKPVVRRAVD